ncbi:MAG: ATP-binding protein [Chitinophagaceae bacterium]
MIKHSLILLFIWFMDISVIGQATAVDSLENVINALTNDSSKVNQLNRLADKLLFSNPQNGYKILRSSIEIAEQINYSYGLSVAYGLEGNMLFYQMKLDSCKLLIDKAYGLIKGNNDRLSKTQQGLLKNRYAAIYQQRQKYDSAVQLYLEAAAVFTELKDESKLIYSFYNLSGIYNFLQDSVKAIFYARETRRIASKTNDSVFIVRSLIALGDAFVSLKEYDSVKMISQQGLNLANKSNLTFAIGKFHSLLGIYYAESATRYDTALFHFNAALASYNKINTRYDIALVLQHIGSTYLKMNDYVKAIKYSKQAIEASKEVGLDQVRRLSLFDLVKAEEKLGLLNESFGHLKEYVEVNDSVQIRNNRRMADELETKYQTQKKEALLLVQQKTIQQQNLLNYLLAASVMGILIIFFLSYRTYRQKQKLQQQRVNELETEKKLLATEAVLKGEEQERTRLAKDLHDGLGGMLSGIKYSLNTMKGNLVMTADNSKSFERSMDMLDSSIKEMRRVAHNMMPEALVKFGLDTALRDFCNDINQTGVLQVMYQSINLENIAIDQTVSITIYRIIQELINNSIKHAGGTTAIVQLTRTNNQLNVTVEDDGKGFDTSLIDIAKGIGWTNIRHRVEFLKGNLDIQSSPGKGTSVHIELNNVI